MTIQKIPIILNISDSYLNVGCISKRGNFDESMEIDQHGDDLKIGIASKLLTDTLKSIETEEVMLEFNTPQSPCLIKPVEGDGFIYPCASDKIKKLRTNKNGKY